MFGFKRFFLKVLKSCELIPKIFGIEIDFYFSLQLLIQLSPKDRAVFLKVFKVRVKQVFLQFHFVIEGERQKKGLIKGNASIFPWLQYPVCALLCNANRKKKQGTSNCCSIRKFSSDEGPSDM